MRFQRLRRGVVAAALACCAAALASEALAHPHVWVTVETEIVYNDQKEITGFKHKWTFDEAYSSFATMGLDANNDGKLDRQELAELTEVNVSALKEFDYFTFPKVAGKVLDREPPKDYWLEYTDNKLVLYLTLPLKQPLPAAQVKDLVFQVYDPTYYVDFTFAEKDPVKLANAPAGCKPVVKDPHPQGPSKVTTLGELNYNNLTAANTDADQYAKSVSISCASG
jgi:ABC-type uncharacterized transport system substrate-binding protein